MPKDNQVFREDQLLYCRKHQTIHRVGECNAPVSEKVSLGNGDKNSAILKCIRFGFKLRGLHPEGPSTYKRESAVETFGKEVWVYCNQHLAAHKTGWCGVHSRDKVGLGVMSREEADNKVADWGFEVYQG